MKKNILSVLVTVLVSLMFAIPSFAADNELIGGKPMYYGANSEHIFGSTPYITDGDLDTYFEAGPQSSDDSTIDNAYYFFDVPMTITGYKLKADGAPNNPYLRFYDENGSSLLELRLSYNNLDINWQYKEITVENVSFAALHYGTTTTMKMYELALYGHPTPPAVPSGLTATPGPGDGEVTLQWDPNDEPDLAGYIVYRDGTRLNQDPIIETTYIDSGLPPGNYTYTVRAIDDNGSMSDPSAPVSVEIEEPVIPPPAAPSGLTATPGDGEVTLQWDPNDEPDLAGYIVYRDGTRLNQDPITETKYVDASVQPGRSYTYTVRAINTSEILSDPSAPATVVMPELPTSPPANVRAFPMNSAVKVTWAPKEGATSYLVYRDGVPIATVTGTDYEDSDVENGVTYLYQVAAVVDGVEGDLSPPVRATPGDFLSFEVRSPSLSTVLGSAWNFIKKYNPYIIMVLAIILIPTLVGFVLWLAYRIRDRANFEKGQRYKEEAMRSMREERGPARDRIMEVSEKRDRHIEKLMEDSVLQSRDHREYVEKMSVVGRGITRKNQEIIREHRRARESREPIYAGRKERGARTARPERGARRGRE